MRTGDESTDTNRNITAIHLSIAVDPMGDGFSEGAGGRTAGGHRAGYGVKR
jgi:hypothetical protein